MDARLEFPGLSIRPDRRAHRTDAARDALHRHPWRGDGKPCEAGPALATFAVASTKGLAASRGCAGAQPMGNRHA